MDNNIINTTDRPFVELWLSLIKPELKLPSFLMLKRLCFTGIGSYIDSELKQKCTITYGKQMKRLVAIDLKLGKFKPEHKAQMELYLCWLERYEMQPDEQKPIGLLLCSEDNTEHVVLLMLDEK